MHYRALEAKITAALGFAGYAIGAWSIVWAQPYDACIYVLITACGLTLLLATAKGNMWSITPKPGRLSIGALGFLPSIALGLRGWWDWQLVDWVPPLLWAVGTAAVLSVLVAVTEQKVRPGSLLPVFALGVSAIWGILIFVNSRFDNDPGTPVPVTVLEKSIANPKSPDYRLYLSRWGNRRDGDPVEVTQGFHARLTRGDELCVYPRKGKLGFAWFEVESCIPVSS